MSYDVNRLRDTHPPACTCVQCTERRAARRRGRGGSRRGGGGNGPGGKRFGCLPFVLGVVAAAAILALAL